MKLRSALAAVTLLVLAVPVSAGAREPSLLQLLADPSRYEGRKVLVTGYCRLEFQGTAIFLHKQDYTHTLAHHLWLVFPPASITAKIKNIDYCLVEGVFKPKNKGHMSLYRGAIENITRYEPWPPTPARKR